MSTDRPHEIASPVLNSRGRVDTDAYEDTLRSEMNLSDRQPRPAAAHVHQFTRRPATPPKRRVETWRCSCGEVRL